MKTPLVQIVGLMVVFLSGCGGDSSGVQVVGVMNDGTTVGVRRDSIRKMGDAEVMAIQVDVYSPEQIQRDKEGRARLKKTMGIEYPNPPTVSMEWVYRFNCVSRQYQIDDMSFVDESGTRRHDDPKTTLINGTGGVVLPTSARERVMDYACLPYWKRRLGIF